VHRYERVVSTGSIGGLSNSYERDRQSKGNTYTRVDGSDLVTAAATTVVTAALSIDNTRDSTSSTALQLSCVQVDRLGGVVEGDSSGQLCCERENEELEEHFVGGW